MSHENGGMKMKEITPESLAWIKKDLVTISLLTAESEPGSQDFVICEVAKHALKELGE